MFTIPIGRLHIYESYMARIRASIGTIKSARPLSKAHVPDEIADGEIGALRVGRLAAGDREVLDQDLLHPAILVIAVDHGRAGHAVAGIADVAQCDAFDAAAGAGVVFGVVADMEVEQLPFLD